MDPRADNCKAFAKDSGGRIVGVELTYRENPNAKYQLYRVSLVDEPQNGIGGPTVAKFQVLNKDNIQVEERVYLAYPWWSYGNWLLPGNANHEHFISNKYTPPERGPLALFVGDEHHGVISDEVGGFGLPEGHHVSYSLVFRERTTGGNPDPEEPGDPGDPVDNGAIVDAIDRLTATIREAWHLP